MNFPLKKQGLKSYLQRVKYRSFIIRLGLVLFLYVFSTIGYKRQKEGVFRYFGEKIL